MLPHILALSGKHFDNYRSTFDSYFETRFKHANCYGVLLVLIVETKMEEYKVINAELIDQVQKQKWELAEYRKNIIKLQAQLLEEHERRVLEKCHLLSEAKHTEFKVKQAINALVRSLDINLKDLDTSHDNAEDVTPKSSVSHAEKSSQSRHSSRLCVELQRSTALIHRTYAQSPNRRSSRNNSSSSRSSSSFRSITTSTESDEQPLDSASSPIVDAAVVDMDISLQPEHTEAEMSAAQYEPSLPMHLVSIIEENETEEDSSPVNCDTSSEFVDSVIILTTPVSCRKRQLTTEYPLRDVTNVTKGIIPKITVTRSSSKPKASNQDHESMDDSSIQLGRHAVRPLSPSAEMLSTIKQTANVTDLSPRRISTSLEISYGIANACGSTPLVLSFESIHEPTDVEETFIAAKQEKNRIRPTSKSKRAFDSHNKKKRSQQKTESEPSTSSISLGRPSRSCRPSSLQEPSIRCKLRNQSAEKSLCRK